jgi:hypothetical protein
MMKYIILSLALTLMLCMGCKHLRRSSDQPADSLRADTMQNGYPETDSALFSSNQNKLNEGSLMTGAKGSTVKGKYYMIVGCFTVQANADKYAEKIKGMGYESQIIPGNNNFQMVVAKTYDTYRESVNEIDKFRNEVTPNAWVFLKR